MSVKVDGEWKPRLVGSLEPDLIVRVAYDLTGYTSPTVTLWDSAGNAKVSTYAVSLTVISTSATDPLSQLTWTPLAAHVDTEGVYLAAFEATSPGGAAIRLGHIRLRLDSYGPPF